MIPVIIPSLGGDCFAVYEPADGSAVLICPPFGDEAPKTARTWYVLAKKLAACGVASLRLDLPGTGNSAGRSTDPSRIEAWQAAVKACSKWLSHRHGERISLLGYHFGALLALDAVATGVVAEKLVLLDPPRSGAAHARYLRARSRMKMNSPASEGPGYIQVGNEIVAETTLARMADLPASTHLGCQLPTLLVLRDEAFATDHWSKIFAASSIEAIQFEGYAEFALEDSLHARHPMQTLDRIAEYVSRSNQAKMASTGQALPGSGKLHLAGLTETAIRFGPEHQMFGILCVPEQPLDGDPALILPSMGIDPCSGMARMWTDLARDLARSGVTSLRFDMLGVGESHGTIDDERLTAVYHPDRINDVNWAVIAVTNLGFTEVSVVAYCSGAYAAWHAALRNPRITSILTCNLTYLNVQTLYKDDVLFAPPGSSRLGLGGGSMKRFIPSRCLTFLRKADDRSRKFVPRPLRHVLRLWETDQRQTRSHVKKLLARGCAVMMITSHDDHGHQRLRRAYGEQLRLPSGVKLKVIADADHTLSGRQHRAAFLTEAKEFVLQQTSDTRRIADIVVAGANRDGGAGMSEALEGIEDAHLATAARQGGR